MTGKGRKMRRTILPAIAAGVMMLSALNQTEVTAKTLKDGEVKAEKVWQDSGQQVYTKEPRCGDRVTLSFAGDISFAEGYANMSYYHSNGNDITKCITPEVIARMDRADIMMVNNEFTYSNRGKPLSGKTFTFRARPETAANLSLISADIVSRANNHVYY